MSDHEKPDLAPLDAEIAAMLRRESSRLDDVPDGVEARLWNKLGGALGGGGGDGGGDVGGGDVGGGGGGAGGKGGGVTAATGTGGALGSTFARIVPYVVTLAVGVGIGAFAHSRMQEDRSATATPATGRGAPGAQSTPVPEATSARASAATAAPTSSMATVSVDSLPTVAAPASAAPRASGSAGGEEDAFVRERKLLDAARTALASGDTATTLAKIEEHVRSYPRGRFEEEREALRVRALADAGLAAEAKSAAAHFEARWPGSVLLPAVRAAAR